MTTFVDANVFLYASGVEHPLREPCQAILRRIEEGRLSAATSAEVAQEVLFVASRSKRVDAALELARGLIALFPDLLPVTREDVKLACDLFERHPGLPIRDAVHAATMRNNGLTTIVTADRHFDAIPGIRRMDPAIAAARPA